jgi:hypothetical protein
MHIKHLIAVFHSISLSFTNTLKELQFDYPIKAVSRGGRR